MTSDEQLEQWVKGNPIHNPDRDECCPDFSCCRPELLADEKTRIAFRDNPDQRMGMLGMFLGAALAAEDVYIAGVDDPDASHH